MKSLSLLLLVLLITGCAPNPQGNEAEERYPILKKYVGKEITIQFKRNELGLASNMMLAPTSTGLNSSMASMRGILIEVSDDGLFITGYYFMNPGDPVRTFDAWVPHGAILTIITRDGSLRQ